MKKFAIVFFLFVSISYSQLRPDTYLLNKEKLSKISDQTPTSNTITDIVIEEGIIWLGTSRGLSKSVDNGENWTNFYKTEAFGEEQVIAVGFNNGIIFAATGHSTNVSDQSLPEGSGLRYSEDYGETWHKIDQPVDDAGDSLITYGINTIRALPVTTKINNITYDVAFTKNTIWIANFAGGLRKSNNNGETWERVVLPPDNLDSIKPTDTLNFSLQPAAGDFGPEDYLNHRVFSVISANDSTVYVGTAGGINKSTDNGKSWVKFNFLNQEKHISGNFVTALAYDKALKAIWAATWKAEDLNENWGVSYSTDGGQKWEISLPGERPHNFGFKYFGTPPNFTSSHVFAATDNGIFRSSDQGRTWILPPTIRDSETRVPISTTVFYSMNSKRLEDNTADLWIGSTNGLAKLNESTGFWEGTWTVYLASPDVVKKSETFAFPNPFSPKFQQVKIKYITEDDASNVTIRLFDFGMNLVRTLIQNAPRGGTGDKIEFWDGKNEEGDVVPNGVYFYRIDIDSKEPLYGKIMVLK